MDPIPVLARDSVRVRVHNSGAAGNLVLFGVGRDESGVRHRYRSTQPYTSTDRSLELLRFLPIGWKGTLDNIHLLGSPTGTRRGQLYCQGQLLDNLDLELAYLFAGYKEREFNLPMGFFESSLSGRGYLNSRTAFFDRAGTVTTVVPLAAANARRRVRGLVWYWESSSDVDTRLLEIRIASPISDAVPTGFSIAEIIYTTATLTLTANEQGIVYIGQDGSSFTVVSDNGARTFANNTTAPHPFPMWVHQGDPVEVQFLQTDGHANDRHALYILDEEWIED